MITDDRDQAARLDGGQEFAAPIEGGADLGGIRLGDDEQGA
jgi:hypothetical protein